MKMKVPIKPLKNNLHRDDSILMIIGQGEGISHLDFLKKWDSLNIYDKWWRKKHQVPFGSEAHLSMNHIFMSLEFKEDTILSKKKPDIEDFESNNDNILKKAGISIKSNDRVVQLSGKDLDDEFNNLNLNDFNDA